MGLAASDSMVFQPPDIMGAACGIIRPLIQEVSEIRTDQQQGGVDDGADRKSGWR